MTDKERTDEKILTEFKKLYRDYKAGKYDV